MSYLILAGVVLLILITGFVKIILSIKPLIDDLNFVQEYRQKFIQFTTPYLQRLQTPLSQQALDSRLYHWLVSNMDKTQGLLGHFGVAHYTAPFGRFQAANYPYIINTVRQVRTEEAERNDILMCEDMMVRYIGAMNRTIDTDKNKIKNPFSWLQQGIQFYLGFPIRLLNWFGIISDNSFDAIVSSKLFKVLAGIGGLAGFLASVVSILQGWPFLKELIK